MKNVCKICGRVFDAETAKKQICSEGCRKIAEKITRQKYRVKNKEYQHRYYETTLKQKRAEQKNSIVTNENKATEILNNTNENKATEILNNTNETSDLQSDIVIETLNKTIIDNLELLDEIKAELLKVLNELKAKQSAYEQKDFSILHAFEGTESDTKLLELARQCKENRKGRRDYKNYIQFLNGIIKGLPQSALKSFEDAKQAQSYRNTFYSIKY